MTAPVRSGTGLICLTEAVNAAAALDAAARLGVLEFLAAPPADARGVAAVKKRYRVPPDQRSHCRPVEVRLADLARQTPSGPRCPIEVT